LKVGESVGPDICAGIGESVQARQCSAPEPAVVSNAGSRSGAHRPEKFQEQPRLLLFVSINRSTRNRVAPKGHSESHSLESDSLESHLGSHRERIEF
jgi:hypothetical protein